MLANDWLHIIDLTLIPDSAASALLELVEPDVGIWDGHDKNERLRLAYVEFCGLCKLHKIRYLHA